MKILTLITGVISSMLWLFSSLVSVKAKTGNTSDFQDAEIILDGKDFMA